MQRTRKQGRTTGITLHCLQPCVVDAGGKGEKGEKGGARMALCRGRALAMQTISPQGSKQADEQAAYIHVLLGGFVHLGRLDRALPGLLVLCVLRFPLLHLVKGRGLVQWG